MTKRADHSTKLSVNTKQVKAQPVAETKKNKRDAREEEDTLAQNQKELGVSEDHTTEDMKQGHRGTFP